MSDLTDTRGKRYGHPHDHFSRTLAILRIVLGAETCIGELRPKDWAVIMECDKLARWAETRDDADSQLDIGGYSETYAMCEERDGAPK